MKLKRRTKKRVQRMLCATLAAASLLGLWPGQASAAELDGSISEEIETNDQIAQANLQTVKENMDSIAAHLGVPVEELRIVRIHYAVNGKSVDIPGNQVYNNGTQAILYESCFANPNQLFVLHDLGNGYYQIYCLQSGKLLEVRNSNHQDGAAISQWSAHSLNCSMWRIVKNSNNTVSFVNKESGKRINVSGGGDAKNTTPLISYHDDRTAADDFIIRNVSLDEIQCVTGGRYVRLLYAISPGKCVDVPAEGILKNGTQLQLWDRYYGNQNQIYVLENTGSGWIIKNCQSGKLLEVHSQKNGSAVVQCDAHNATAFARWDVLVNTDGSVSIRNRGSGEYLNLCGGGVGKNGQKFIQWFDDRSESMRFQVEVMGTADVLSAVYVRNVTTDSLRWTQYNPWFDTTVHNLTGWELRSGKNYYYPSVGQKVLVSAEYLDPNTVTKILKDYAYSDSVLKKIKDVLAGGLSEKAVEEVLSQLDLDDVPGIGAALGILQTILAIQDDEERNRFIDAVKTDNPQERSGVIIYTYKTVVDIPMCGFANNATTAMVTHHYIKTVTSVEYGSWNGSDFADVCNLRLNGTSGTWHYCFK